MLADNKQRESELIRVLTQVCLHSLRYFFEISRNAAEARSSNYQRGIEARSKDFRSGSKDFRSAVEELSKRSHKNVEEMTVIFRRKCGAVSDLCRFCIGAESADGRRLTDKIKLSVERKAAILKLLDKKDSDIEFYDNPDTNRYSD